MGDLALAGDGHARPVAMSRQTSPAPKEWWYGHWQGCPLLCLAMAIEFLCVAPDGPQWLLIHLPVFWWCAVGGCGDVGVMCAMGVCDDVGVMCAIGVCGDV